MSTALILTESDDFNALAAFELRQELGSTRVYRLAPAGAELDLVPAYAEGGMLFDERLTYAELTRRFQAGAGVVELAPGAIARSRGPRTPFRDPRPGRGGGGHRRSPGRAGRGRPPDLPRRSDRAPRPDARIRYDNMTY